MNTLTKAAIILHRENVLKDILLDQYALFIVRIKEQKERSNASALSFLRNMVTLPSSMLDGNPPPQLEVNNSNASEQAVVFASRIVSTTANLLTGTQGVEHIHLWFAFLQLWTETVFERDLRDKIGRYLVLHPQARLADIYNNPNNPDISLEKPLGQYMIYRWADVRVHPAQHVLHLILFFLFFFPDFAALHRDAARAPSHAALLASVSVVDLCPGHQPWTGQLQPLLWHALPRHAAKSSRRKEEGKLFFFFTYMH